MLFELMIPFRRTRTFAPISSWLCVVSYPSKRPIGLTTSMSAYHRSSVWRFATTHRDDLASTQLRQQSRHYFVMRGLAETGLPASYHRHLHRYRRRRRNRNRHVRYDCICLAPAGILFGGPPV